MCTTRYDQGRRSTYLLILLLTSSLGAACGDDRAGDPTAPAGTPSLATASTAPPFDSISVGDLHTCAIGLDDRAWCWGWNVFGRLGDGTETERLRPVMVKVGLHYKSLSAGWYRTCAVAMDTKTYCWDKLPAAMATSLKFRQVTVGSEHVCGITATNKAYCWGDNTFGQIGNGRWDDSYHPPTAVMGGRSFRQITVGNYHTCAITTDDKLYCWGGDQWGQLGDGSVSGTCNDPPWELPCRTAPQLVAGGHTWRQVDAGGGYGPGEGGGGDDGGRTCGVTTDNMAYCWGAGMHGQNGDGTTGLRNAPARVVGRLSWKSVSAGTWHTCGVTNANEPYCWGFNRIGELGDGSLTQRTVPTPVAGGHHFRIVGAGGGHTCALTPANVAWCWGAGSATGDGTSMIRRRPVRVIGPS